MKKILLASAGVFALGAFAPATAADLGRPYTKAPVAAAVAVYDWSGLYIGINAGGASAHKCWDISTFLGFPVVPAVAEGCHDATGAVVGGQIGYRWQAANWVFGLEAQGDWANLSGSNVSSPAALGPLVTNRSRIDALGLFTGQVGYAFSNVLWYVKGGAALTSDKYNGIMPVIGAFDEATETRWGATVGTGFEFGFASNWSVGVEYDHLFMGSRSLSFISIAPPVGIASRTDTIRQGVDMVTVRVNYRFGGPVVARY